ncbi:MAG: hypothetical protein JXR77_19580 [Lentisphaeria bacterium]|nr:hypothetical protein [Lentisphaeria bacterium]
MDAAARHARREHWRGVVETWRESGLSQAAFCREHQLRPWQFAYWLYQADRPLADGRTPVGSFARVETTGGSGLRLRIAGLELEIEPGFDEATLRRFLRAIRPPC